MFKVYKFGEKWLLEHNVSIAVSFDTKEEAMKAAEESLYPPREVSWKYGERGSLFFVSHSAEPGTYIGTYDR